jgi:hypothetical protein
LNGARERRIASALGACRMHTINDKPKRARTPGVVILEGSRRSDGVATAAAVLALGFVYL